MVQLGGSERLMVSHDFFEKLMATSVIPIAGQAYTVAWEKFAL